MMKKLHHSLRHSLGKLRSALELRGAVLTRQWDWLLRRKYNRWARWGLGHELESQHLGIIEKMLKKMDLSPGDRILDLGCGEAMACRLMADRLGDSGHIVGVDIADGMLQNARAKSAGYKNMTFVCGPAEHIPCPDNSFNKALSVEAFYFFQHQDRVLQELFRVLAPGGRLFVVLCLHKDNPDSFGEVDEVGMPVHIRSADEYGDLLRSGGWTDIHTEIFVPENEPGIKLNMHERSLAITARKPSSEHHSAVTDSK
jgi:SAM-dependent methyltransferase